MMKYLLAMLAAVQICAAAEGNIVFLGDSITYGQGLVSPNQYPTQAIAQLTDHGTTYTYSNQGLSNQRASQIDANFATQVPATGAGRNVIVCLAGINDLYYVGSPSAAYDSLKSIWAKGRAAGYKVIAATLLPAISVDDSLTQALNTLIASDPTLYDARADYRNTPSTLSAACTAGTTWMQIDCVHPTAAGALVLAGIAASVIESLFPANRVVCSSGCQYSTAQSAYDASAPGDTIVLKSGQNHGSLVIPGGAHNLTIKSGFIDTYPREFRMARNHPALARLTTVTMGDPYRFFKLTGPGPTVTTLSPHNLEVNDQVSISMPNGAHSAFVCATGVLNQEPYGADCSSSRLGFINVRADTGYQNGHVIQFIGRSVPPPLQLSTSYYIVNFFRSGGVDSFQLAATSGGAPIEIPQFNPAGQDFVLTFPPLPAGNEQPLYVVAKTSTTLQLSTSLGGPPITFTQAKKQETTGGLDYGFLFSKDAPVHDITFDGIEVFPTSDFYVFYPFYVISSISSRAGEPYSLKIFRSWMHGHDDQETFPYVIANIAARDIEIGWSVFDGAYSVSNDTQNINFMSTGGVYIHDNEIKDAAEGIMSGGNLPWFSFNHNTTGIRIERNRFWKSAGYTLGLQAVYVDPAHFKLAARLAPGVPDCDTTATSTNLSYRCFAYSGDESDPSNPLLNYAEWTANAADSTFTVTSAAPTTACSSSGTGTPYGNYGCGFIYLAGTTFHMDYNFGEGASVTCPTGVVCHAVDVPSFPTWSTRIGIAVMGSAGVFDSSFSAENRHVLSKNGLESKYGDKWHIEANTFRHQSFCGIGNVCQDMGINMTNAPNGSNSGEPINYKVSSSHSVIKNNIFAMMGAGVTAIGKSFGFGTVQEVAGFGQTTDNVLHNNLFYDLGSTEYQARQNGAMLNSQAVDHWTVSHNTVVDTRVSFQSVTSTAMTYHSNIITPYRRVCSEGTCTHPPLTSHKGVLSDLEFLPNPNAPFPIFAGDSILSWQTGVDNGNVAGTFENNLLMNRPGYLYYTARPTHYPNSTYLNNADDLISGQTPDPSILFQEWHERDNNVVPNGLNYRASNFRLASGMAALFPAYDADGLGHPRAIGADIDEIEALTGKAGVDVEKGRPKFSDRVARQIEPGSSTAVVSYLPNGSSCTLQVWSNADYSGAPTVDMTDSAADRLAGRMFLAITGLSARTSYWGKRWCGTEVDVFSFRTQPATPVQVLQVSPPSGVASCQVQYGSTSALGSTTTPSAVDNGVCRATIPTVSAGQQLYWRMAYLASGGASLYTGPIAVVLP